MRITRRAFLGGALLAGVGLAPLARRYFLAVEARADSMVRVLCDLFVPGHDAVPGAVALGIDRVVADKRRQTRRGRAALLLLARDLDGRSFFSMTSDAQTAYLKDQLALGAEPGASLNASTLYNIYHDCVYEYLTRPEAWPSIHYRTPQPHGYPDYTECVAS